MRREIYTVSFFFFFFNISLLIVHCRLRDIVISTIHLFTCFIIIIILIINNNRNCILLLQIYRFVACVCVCVVSVCIYTVVLFFCFIQKWDSTHLGGRSLYNLRVSMPRREQKATISAGMAEEEE